MHILLNSTFMVLCVIFLASGTLKADNNLWTEQRNQMVQKQLQARDINQDEVLEAMQSVERHKFVPEEHRHAAYQDQALPIGYDQTISQPYIVALMTQLADVQEQDRVLEIGTGSGYQAAVLGELTKEVYTIEIIEELARAAEDILQELGYDHIQVRAGDGFAGWPEQAPFDSIIVTCAPPEIPQPLLEQLAPTGRLIIPVGEAWQELKMVHKKKDGTLEEETVASVRFVPMTGPGVQENTD